MELNPGLQMEGGSGEKDFWGEKLFRNLRESCGKTGSKALHPSSYLQTHRLLFKTTHQLLPSRHDRETEKDTREIGEHLDGAPSSLFHCRLLADPPAPASSSCCSTCVLLSAVGIGAASTPATDLVPSTTWPSQHPSTTWPSQHPQIPSICCTIRFHLQFVSSCFQVILMMHTSCSMKCFNQKPSQNGLEGFILKKGEWTVCSIHTSKKQKKSQQIDKKDEESIDSD
ncbi:hypothetical protein LXL04_015419 [Taraxacum kok-saghyz]